MGLQKKTLASFRHMRAPPPGNGPKYVARLGCPAFLLGMFALMGAGGFMALVITLFPLLLHARITRGGPMVSDEPLTGHENFDTALRVYILPFIILNGMLLAGILVLAEAGNDFWKLLGIAAAPLLLLQIWVAFVTQDHIVDAQMAEDDAPD